MKAQDCRLCGRETWRVDGICRACEPLPTFGTGLFPCCGGYGEHFEHCSTGTVIARARDLVARAQARRVA